ncbi:hypothetical protein [Actinoplanes sp. NPDC051851]|uniref:alpha/beta hydrolase n=1 Tax=Actinoplanes sp. NPDC051851 TaxID=3154753 RepID=UPI003430495C
MVIRTALLALTVAGSVALAPIAPTALTLPAPTGPFPVGTVDLHLVDRSRADPWTADPAYRELMVSLWYPAADVDRFPLAPHMTPGAAAHFGGADGAATQLYDIPAGAVDFATTRTGGHLGAPIARQRQPFPVVLYSPGAGDPRTWETTVVQDLASRGYVVVTIDHTYDASEVEFPDGRVAGGVLPKLFSEISEPAGFQALAGKIFDVRVDDTRFVLDELAALNGGANPDAEHRPLPTGVAGALDLRRTGMFGVSAGGMTALQTMDEDPRITAAIDMDGAVESPLLTDPIALWPVARDGLDGPFLLMGDEATDHRQTPSWSMLWDNSGGWHGDVRLTGATSEDAYKDAVPLLPQIARQLGLPDDFVTGALGTIDPDRAVPAEEAVVGSFFDRWLLGGHDDHLLDGPSPRCPDLTFVS